MKYFVLALLSLCIFAVVIVTGKFLMRLKNKFFPNEGLVTQIKPPVDESKIDL